MRPLVYYDLETTDNDPATARIVQAAFVAEDGSVLFESLVHPGGPIPPESIRIHGITDERVADAPSFDEIAERVQRVVEGVVLVGYNSKRFDAPVLDAELRRAGQPGLDLADVEEIDVFRVWQAAEPRTLSGAVRHFLDQDHGAAHDAAADALATRAVLEVLARKHGLAREDLLALTRPSWEVDRAGKFRRDEQTGEVRFAFGKLSGEPAAAHPDYLRWMLRQDFPGGTKAVVERLLGGDS